eukprot:scaffold31751_cov19-Tisochrysis_lutea.AAC.2
MVCGGKFWFWLAFGKGTAIGRCSGGAQATVLGQKDGERPPPFDLDNSASAAAAAAAAAAAYGLNTAGCNVAASVS